MPRQVNLRITDTAYDELCKQADVAMDTPTGFATRILLTRLSRPMPEYPLCCDNDSHDCAADA